MKPTTIEWRRADAELPGDDALVLISDDDGDVALAFFEDGQWRMWDAIPVDTPVWWAHVPPPEVAS